MREISAAEIRLCEWLRPALDSLPATAEIGNLKVLGRVCSALERFLPGVIGEIHSECPALDGVHPTRTEKHSENEIEILGLCCLMSHVLTPLQVRLQLAETDDSISWLECRLGEQVDGRMRTIPYNEKYVLYDKYRLIDPLESIEWFYQVGYGQRQAGQEPPEPAG